jgi:hypothetical protein
MIPSMKNTTDHPSFILRPSTSEGGGVGVFALRDINAGEEIFANYNELGEPEDRK